MGTSSTALPGQSGCHSARETSPCRFATPLTRRDSRSAVAVMWKTDRHEFFGADAQLGPDRSRAGLHLLPAEAVVTRRDGSVSREDAPGAHLAYRVLERHSSGGQLAQPLDKHERGVSLVRVPGGRIESHGPQHPHPSNAEDPFLAEPHVRPAGVKLSGKVTIGRVVLFQVCVQEVNRYPSDLHPPDADVHRPPEGLHHGEIGNTSRSGDSLERRQAHIKEDIAVLLPAIQPQLLVEVAFRVEEPNADEGHAEI
jgi:hypothetical protein